MKNTNQTPACSSASFAGSMTAHMAMCLPVLIITTKFAASSLHVVIPTQDEVNELTSPDHPP
jgi:hypothetical protein